MATGALVLLPCSHGNHRMCILVHRLGLACMFLLQGVVHVTSQCSCCCYGILHLLLLSLFPDSILEYVASESTLSSGSDSLALSQAAKEREKSLFEDKKVCVCAYLRVCVVCTFVCLCVCCWCSVGTIDHG